MEDEAVKHNLERRPPKKDLFNMAEWFQTDTSFLVFGMTQPGIEPTIYHTQSDHTNQCTTEM
jgi:hypothetical protein